MASLGFGTSITFQSGFFAEITDVKISGIARESVDVTNFASTNGWKEFIPSEMKDGGELEVEIIHDTNDAAPVDQASETVTITFPLKGAESSGATYASSGFMTNYDITVPGEDKITATATIKFSGAPTVTAGS